MHLENGNSLPQDPLRDLSISRDSLDQTDPIDLNMSLYENHFKETPPESPEPGPDESSDQTSPPNNSPTPEPSVGGRLLRMIMIGMMATGAYMMFNGSGNDEERQETELRETLSPEELASPITGISDILPSVNSALEQIEAGVFKPEVQEFENHFNGNFTYQFELDPEKAGREKSVILNGVKGGSERETLLEAIAEADMVIRTAPQEISDGKAEVGTFQRMLPSMIMWGAVIGVSIYMFRRIGKSMGGGGAGMMGSITQAEAEIFAGGELDDRLDDLGGLDHVVDEMRELKARIDRVRDGDPEVTLQRGTLLTGPPGVGKTKLVRSLAGEVECPFVKFDCSQLSTQIFVGSGTGRVTNAFAQARALRDAETKRLRELPGATGKEEGVCIICLDEFDSIGMKRPDGTMPETNSSEQLKVVNTLLNEMDGFNKERNKNIIVFAATNNPKLLDPALLRPGRFTKTTEIDLPRSAAQRLEILQKLEGPILGKRGYSIDSPRSLEYISQITPGKSGDHLRQILVEASDIADLDGRKNITQADLFESAQRESSGRIRKNYLPREKHELVAHHEHGHALTSIATGVDIFLVSMLPRGSSAGRVIPDPEGLAETLTTRKDYLSRILLGAGGRAAELEAYGDNGYTDGAVSDLEQIRAIVGAMITVGMIDDMYSMNLSSIPPQQWKDKHHNIIDSVATEAVQAAREILQVVGEERMQELVTESIDIGQELVGDNAQQFYEERLDPQLIAEMKEVAKKFFGDPLGRERADEGGEPESSQA